MLPPDAASSVEGLRQIKREFYEVQPDVVRSHLAPLRLVSRPGAAKVPPKRRNKSSPAVAKNSLTD